MTAPDPIRPEIRFAIWCILVYVTIYAFEAPLRYALYFVRLDEVILFRDLLILVPLLNIAVRQLIERRLHPALPLAAFLVVLQGGIFYLNFHAIGPVILGTKIFTNTVLCLIVGQHIIGAGPKITRYLVALLLVTCAGLFLEKFVFRFPWVGMTTIIGGIQVDISHDWQVEDELTRRVGGFTRESICAAGFVPFLALMLIPRCPTYLRRVATILLMIASVALTTQKGALAAAVLIGLCMMLPAALRLGCLRILVLVAGVVQIVLPFATNGMLMAEGDGGVFSSSSIAARVLYTWPQGLAYLSDRSVGPFGVGLGGMAGPLRLVQPLDLSTFADNMFLFLFAYFGVFAAIYYGAIVAGVWRSLSIPPRLAEPALALCAFCLIYGVVVTVFEDQVDAMAVGIGLATLLNVKVAQPTPTGLPSARVRPPISLPT